MNIVRHLVLARRTSTLSIVTLLFFPLLTLVVAPCVTAQSLSPVSMLNEALPEMNAAAMGPIAPVAPLPDAPAPQLAKAKMKVKIIDKKFIVTMAALGGAETLRFTTHKLVLDHEYAAGAPWVTSVPQNQHLIAKYSAIFAAELLVAYELKKPHSWLPGDKYIQKFWWAYPAVMTPIHIKNGVRSIRTQPPSCPVEECGAQ